MNSPQFTGKQNDLFAVGESKHLNACVGHNGGPYSYDDYSRGYFWAGDRLVKSLQQNSSDLDVVIYPVVYVYRHGIELALKHLAIHLPSVLDEHDEVKQTHKLIDNWNIIRPLIMKCDYLDPKNTVPTVDKILTDFTEIDASGEVFRFPESRRGEKYLEDTSFINIEVFGEVMSTLHEVFEFWFNITSELFDAKMETQNQDNGIRPFGLCAGEFTVPNDFDAPLPEDLLTAFEGK